ncbi:MAG: flagellar basal body P-ring formation protein FlgA [Deltaproteobacteria bacterium]|nr:flagellar basal body P-ring formation protein FlgA [Deltaproteobacteria bacterium]
MNCFKSIISLSALLIATAFNSAASANSFTGGFVTVGDIVKNCSGDVCDITVTKSPMPGRSITIHRNRVVHAIKSSGFETSGLKIPKVKKVSLKGIVISSKVISQEIEDKVTETVPEGIVLEKLAKTGAVTVPASGYSIEVIWPDINSFSRHVAVIVEFKSDDNIFLTQRLMTTLKQSITIPVASGNLEAGKIITADDLVLTTIITNALDTSTAYDVNLVLGTKLLENVKSGESLKKQKLQKVPVVFKSQPVTVESNFGSVRVTMRALSRMDGCVGDKIRVMSGSADKMIWAEVTGPGSARVLE